jgi:hypothetical protein
LGEGAASGRARLESLKFSRRDYLAWKGLVRELYPLDYGHPQRRTPRGRFSFMRSQLCAGEAWIDAA